MCDRLLTYLDAFASPRRGTDVPADERQSHGQRLGAAFGSFLEAVDPAALPRHGGDATTVLVTVDLDVLRTGLGVAHVGDEPLSAGEARRLACTANIIPVVLGGASQVLDAGRARRLYSPTQRKALAVTQPTCRGDGCDIPAAWCEAHHAARPGRTAVAPISPTASSCVPSITTERTTVTTSTSECPTVECSSVDACSRSASAESEQPVPDVRRSVSSRACR